MDHTSIPTRRWITWSRDAAERAIKTFAQGVLASGLIMEGASLDVVRTVEHRRSRRCPICSLLAGIQAGRLTGHCTPRSMSDDKVVLERTQVAQDDFDFVMDVDDDEILACGIENPDVCESCQ